MRVIVYVPIEEFTKGQVKEYAECVGFVCKTHKERCQRLIQCYGETIMVKMQDYFRFKEEQE